MTRTLVGNSFPCRRIVRVSTTITIRDETTTGEAANEWTLEVLSEWMTVREIIRSRVYQEVQDYHLQNSDEFRGLVQPLAAQESVSGLRRTKTPVDWHEQFAKVIEAFEKRQIFVLINERQATSLDESFQVGPNTVVCFLRLTLLVGG
jgi:hypothetical protein